MKFYGNQYGRSNWVERFWSKVKTPLFIGECWEWVGMKDAGGYGKFSQPPQTVLAHRFVYEWVIASIPDGLEIDHLCRNRGCVNPYHMEPVTPRVNSLRSMSPAAINARKTHCKNGHPLTEDNLDNYALSRGERMCRTCRNAYQKKWITS